MKKAPSISESLSKSFLQNFNLLLIHSRSIDLSMSLAIAMCAQNIKNSSKVVPSLTILADANEGLVEEVNYHIRKFRQRKIINKQDSSIVPRLINELHKTNKEKRQKLYLQGGTYSVSISILLLDILSGALKPRQLQRLLMFHNSNNLEKAADKYCYYSWVATLITLQTKQVPIVFISSRPQLFNKEALENTLRMMFLKKVVIWPYGRSEIQTSLKDGPKMKKINHRLQLQQSEHKLMDLYSKLIEICKNCNKKEKENKNTQVQAYDIKNLQFLQQSLLFYSKIEHAMNLEHLIEEGLQINGSIWNSNNMGVMETIQQIHKIATNFIYLFRYKANEEQPLSIKVVDLYELMRNYRSTDKKEIKKGDKKENQEQIQDLIRQQSEKDSLESVQSQEEESQFQVKQNKLLLEVDSEIRVYGLLHRSHQSIFSPKFIELIETLKGHEKLDIRPQIVDVQNHDNGLTPKQSQNNFKEVSTEKTTDIIKLTDILIDKIQDQPLKQSVYVQTISRDTIRNIKKQFYIYRTETIYRHTIKLLIYYLSLKREDRIHAIKKLIRRLESAQIKEESQHSKNLKKVVQKNVHSMKNRENQKKQHEVVLLECVYQQLLRVDQIMSHYETVNERSQAQELFSKQISILNENKQLQYTSPEELKLNFEEFRESDDCTIQFKEQNTKYFVYPLSGQSLYDFSKTIRLLQPDLCIFYHPSPLLARHLALLHSQQHVISIREAHVIFFDNTNETELINKIIAEEDKGFWNIGQARQQLGQFIEDPFSRINELIIDDQISKKEQMISLAMSMDVEKQRLQAPLRFTRKILVDKRQFKSLLPSYLYHHGFEIIPIFLDTADYVLSNTLALQKKSVHTKDLHDSLRSGRLADQLRRMSIKFARPYLLIECPDMSYFKSSQLNMCMNKVTGEKFVIQIRRQLIKLLSRYPKVQILWSTSYLQSIDMIIQLKKNQPEPEPSKFKPASESEIDDFFDEEDEQQGREIPMQRRREKKPRKKNSMKNSNIFKIKQQNQQDLQPKFHE